MTSSNLIKNKKNSQLLLNALKDRDENKVMMILNENDLFREDIRHTDQPFYTDIEDQYGFTPLMLATGLSMDQVVMKLLDLHTPTDHQNRYGHTAFTWACVSGQASIARILLLKGVLYSTSEVSQSQFFIFTGADICHQTNEGRTGCVSAYGTIVLSCNYHYLCRFTLCLLEIKASYCRRHLQVYL
jgi:ankyrin repeat protein